MTTIEAIYENGVLRPLAPLSLPEGQRVHVQLNSEEASPSGGSASSILQEIAALPPEGAVDPATSRDHDRVLYGSPNCP